MSSKTVDIPSSSDIENWHSQKIAGVLIIIFFGTVSISSIIFANTYICRKDNEELKDSVFFKIPLVGLSIISSLIIFSIISNNSSKGPIIFILLIMNAIVIMHVFKKSTNIVDPNIKYFIDCFNNFMGYCENCACKYGTIFGEPLASFILPFIFAFFLGITVNSQTDINSKIFFGIFTFCILAEYYFKNRQNSIKSIKELLNSKIPFIGTVFQIIYILLVISTIYFMT